MVNLLVKFDSKVFLVSCLLLLLTIGYANSQHEDVPQTTEVLEDDVVIEEQIVEEIEEVPTQNWTSLGEYVLTAYCPCSKCCGQWANGITSTGVTAQAGRTIAVDPRVIPYGSQIKIGDTVYTAEDCGGAIKGKRIDVYHNTHNEALQFGRQTVEIFILED